MRPRRTLAWCNRQCCFKTNFLAGAGSQANIFISFRPRLHCKEISLFPRNISITYRLQIAPCALLESRTRGNKAFQTLCYSPPNAAPQGLEFCGSNAKPEQGKGIAGEILTFFSACGSFPTDPGLEKGQGRIRTHGRFLPASSFPPPEREIPEISISVQRILPWPGQGNARKPSGHFFSPVTSTRGRRVVSQ